MVVDKEESILPHLILQEVVPMAPMIRHALSWEEKLSPCKEMDHLDGSMMYAPAADDEQSKVAALRSNPKKEQH